MIMRSVRLAPRSVLFATASLTAALVALLAFTPGTARAGAVVSTKIVGVALRASSSDALITLAAELGGGPSCAGTLVANQVAFDHTTPGGKSILTVVTSAYLSGKSVTVTGNNGCVATSTPGVFVEGLESISLN
jgi:hypothetical protein